MGKKTAVALAFLLGIFAAPAVTEQVSCAVELSQPLIHRLPLVENLIKVWTATNIEPEANLSVIEAVHVADLAIVQPPVLPAQPPIEDHKSDGGEATSLALGMIFAFGIRRAFVKFAKSPEGAPYQEWDMGDDD